MMSALERWLDGTTMYRLAEYVLIGLLVAAAILGFADKVPYNGFAVAVSAAGLVAGCWLANAVFAWAFNAPRHGHSAVITGLILALIIPPIQGSSDVWFYFWAPTLAIASKYILAWRRQHIFNPAAFAVAVTGATISASANWWVGTAWMLPFVLLGGTLVVKKIRRWNVVLVFLFTALFSIAVTTLLAHKALGHSLRISLLASPLFFFAAIMLTEPWTMPPTKRLRLAYAALIGLLFAPLIHIGSIYSTPELALLIGNLVFFLLVRRERYVLRVDRKKLIGKSIVDFSFTSDRPILAQPGQYLEWTLPHHAADNRGTRRYFTLSSSPSENRIHLGVKFSNPASSFKEALYKLNQGMTIVAGQVDGDFTLPKDPNKKLVFLAGGIGITPFRSMAQYCIDMREQRSVVLFYAVHDPSEIAYDKVFADAAKYGWETVYVIGDEQSVPATWAGERGRVSAEMIQRYAPDYAERTFYISGPHAMVTALKKTLPTLGIPSRQIKTDYFPGFA